MILLHQIEYRRLLMESIGRQMVDIAEKTVPSVTIKEVFDWHNNQENILVVDVREPDEWAEGHIEGAILLSRGRIEGRIE
ncbi:hypothetical protein FIM12_08105, partial [SAR202 cluster bacterium AD-804-J14_MRT_500m]|nr:hypothetical protein [SAR202 cluster bacterium AD-804-J14_MRT_500m]